MLHNYFLVPPEQKQIGLLALKSKAAQRNNIIIIVYV